ncbi:LAETG motif-containing sortase-dependent surface protein [Actinacidiphila acididurans]|uniref:Cys-Gln thioester bond-forming surface protein n=1 Tax=Actinacidiphila acididurans TaxID=2784346 RepID=A0ABS2TZ99_9ACTN|nr:LAETG motif-containing sortase-dependent surface protein [Actinacidiphila acididurans]MBM9508392.1 Cys-Gln thioester bond-forming surface protein [Actinacidiphila acididurans]
MFKTTRRTAARLAAAGVAAGLLAAGAMTAAGPATADDGTQPSSSGATATIDGIVPGLSDQAVVTENGSTHGEIAGLFRMNLDSGGSILTYCIDFHNGTQDHAQYHEVPWSATSLYAPGKDRAGAGKIDWILQHSFPQVSDLDALAKAAHAGPLTKKTAAAGTQVAIWRYSDGVDVKAKDPAAEQLAEYLYNTAVAVAEPAASLTLTPAAVSGKSGDRLGPVTVHTTATTARPELAASAPSGAKLVDAQGKPVTEVKDGAELYIDIPAGTPDGSTSLTVTASTTVPIGRAFTGTNDKGTPSQTQILAGSDSTDVTASATASWARKGAIPALSAQVDCAKNGVDVTASNQGDEGFTFRLEGRTYTIAPGKSQTVTVPVAEDQKYRIDITLPDKTVKTFQGVLDCRTATTPSPSAPGNQPSPATSPATTSGTTAGGGNLAETGSSSATPVIAGIAAALVVVGGGAVFFFRRKKSSGAS